MVTCHWQAEGLTEGAVYQFQVFAANLAGLGAASQHSADFTCEAWTMPEPGQCLSSSDQLYQPINLKHEE